MSGSSWKRGSRRVDPLCGSTTPPDGPLAAPMRSCCSGRRSDPLLLLQVAPTVLLVLVVVLEASF